MVEAVLKILMLEHRDQLVRIAQEGSTLLSFSPPKHAAAERGMRKIDTVLYLRMHNGTDTKVSFLRAIFERLNLDPYELYFYFQPKREESSDEAEEVEVETVYGELTKFLPHSEEASAVSVEESQIDAMLKEFTVAFEPFRQPDPRLVLNNKSIADFGPVDHATAEEILALISLQLQLAEIAGLAQFREALTSGTMASYLRRLVQLDRAK